MNASNSLGKPRIFFLKFTQICDKQCQIPNQQIDLNNPHTFNILGSSLTHTKIWNIAITETSLDNNKTISLCSTYTNNDECKYKSPAYFALTKTYRHILDSLKPLNYDFPQNINHCITISDINCEDKKLELLIENTQKFLAPFNDIKFTFEDEDELN